MALPILAGLGALGLGTYLTNKQQKDAAGRVLEQSRIGRQKSKVVEEAQRQDVLNTAAMFDPAARQARMDEQADKTQGAIMALLGDNEQLTTGDTGVLPTSLLTQRANSVRQRAEEASRLATLLSKVQAPGNAGAGEGLQLGQLGMDTNSHASDIRRIQALTQTLMGLEGQTNPNSMLLGGLLQGGGQALASGSILSQLRPPGYPGAAGGTV